MQGVVIPYFANFWIIYSWAGGFKNGSLLFRSIQTTSRDPWYTNWEATLRTIQNYYKINNVCYISLEITSTFKTSTLLKTKKLTYNRRQEMWHIWISFIWNKQERFLETQNFVYNKGIVESVFFGIYQKLIMFVTCFWKFKCVFHIDWDWGSRGP